MTSAKKEIDPRIAIGAVIALVLVLVVVYFLVNRQPPAVNATEVYSKAVLADPDPPRPGQAGYHGGKGGSPR